jgi:hypothetical protein
MILFVNTLITDNKSACRYDRGNLKSYSNFDIFKYSLASFAVAHSWSKVILKISLDHNYLDRQQELEHFIKTEFKNSNLVLEWKRNEFQNDWQRDYELLDDNLIWFYCNHDHIFFDSNNQYLNELVEQFKNAHSTTIFFSHFPELIRTVRQGLISASQDLSYISPSYQIHESYASVELDNYDSIQIITKDLYYRWWFGGDFNHEFLPRPDWGKELRRLKSLPMHKVIVPLKEICRHFDGYQHVYPPITNNQCPAIDIPPGFFENNIKIRYGYDDYVEGWVNINPKNSNYYAHDKTGTDYKFTLDDLPLIWMSKISSVDVNPNINDREMINYRLRSILEMIYTSDRYVIDKEIVKKILGIYIKFL